jgi:DNA (cytosine-5)-methyltransferase 1
VSDLEKVEKNEVADAAGIQCGELDVLIGGPPCQGFSTSGKRDILDTRNQEFIRFMTYVREFQPRVFVAENVPAAIGAVASLLDTQIHAFLPEYTVHTFVLNSADFGVPQIRRRAFVTGIRADIAPAGTGFGLDNGGETNGQYWSALESQHRKNIVSVEDAIGDLPSIRAGESYDGLPYPQGAETSYQRDRRDGSIAVFNHVARNHSKEFLEKIAVIAPGQGNSQLPPEMRFSDNYFSQAYARLHPDEPAYTITAHFRNPGSGRFTHYRDARSITVREAARLQSFDDSFIFYGHDVEQERHVGNAVPPLLARGIAETVAEVLIAHSGTHPAGVL